MKWLVVENSTEMPIEALEMLGATDKSLGGFIGKFGTGTKYAIAAALRNGIDIRICLGTRVIRFDTKEVPLSRDTVHRITMQVNNNNPKDRDWTTQMGREDWRDKPEAGLTVDWMIVREFYSNALDEGGVSIHVADRIHPEAGKTKIFIRYTERMEEIIDKISLFFPRGAKKNPRQIVEENKYGRVYFSSRDRGAVYCRGVFVCSLPKPLLFDYDLDYLALTESRTVDPWNFSSALGKFLANASPAFLAKFMRRMHEKGEECYEYGIEEYHLSNLNPEATKQAFDTAFGESAFLSPQNLAASTADQLSRVDAPRIILRDSWRAALSRTGVSDYIDKIDKDLARGYSYIPDGEVDLRVEPSFQAMVRRAFNYCCAFFKVETAPGLRFFEWTGNPDAMVLGNCSDGKVGINVKLPMDEYHMLDVMAEEFAHYVSGAPDLSRELVSTLTKAIAKNGVEKLNNIMS